MTRHMIRRLLQRAPLRQSECGFTLVEALVSMVIFMTSMAVITSVVLAMTNNMRQAQGVSVATDQTRLAFQRLDKQVRYASAVSLPGMGAPGTGWYVELLAEAPDANPGATPPEFSFKKCTQWRLRPDGHLETRSWLILPNAALTPQGPLPSWTTVSTGVINDLTTQPPFTSVPTTFLRPHHEMVVDLRTRRSNRPQGRAHLKTTLYARNSTSTTEQAGVCARPGYRG